MAERPPAQAVEKIIERRSDFKKQGWTKADLFARHPKPYGYHGLAWQIKEHEDIGRVWPFCAELLGRQDGRGTRARLHFWRGAPFATLAARHGKHKIIPSEVEIS